MRSRIARAFCQLACIIALSFGLALLPEVSPADASGAASVRATSAAAGGTPGPRVAPRRATPTPGEVAPAGTPAAATTPLPGATPATPRRASPTASRPFAIVLRQPQPLAVVLNGHDHTSDFTVVIAIADRSSLRSGWELSLAIEQFRTREGRVRELPAGAVTLVRVEVDCAPAGECILPDNGVAYPQSFPAGAARPISTAAPGTGVGDFVVTATFRLSVPANAYAGTYTSIASVRAVAGR